MILYCCVANYFKKSVDSGVTWVDVGNPSPYYSRGLFISLDQLFVVVGRETTIQRSVNGGGVFTLVHTLPTSGAIQDMCSSPSDENFLFACGQYGYVYLSANMGATWSNVQISGFIASNYLRGIHMVSNLVGWVVGRLSIYKTTDGGANWIEQKLLTIEPYDVYAVDENTVYVLEGASNGTLWKTTNGGVDWTNLAPPRQYPGGRIAVVGDKVWFVGNSGVNIEVVYSNDGGSSWNRVQFADTASIGGQTSPIVFASENLGFVFAYHSFSSTDGGQTWIQGGLLGIASYVPVSAKAISDFLLEWRSFNIAGVAPTDRTTQGSVITADNPLNFGSVGAGSNSPVKVLVFRAKSLGLYATISNMRFYLQAKDLVGTNSYYCDITNTWTQNKTPVQVSGGTPGTIPQTEPAANVTKIGGGNITGVGHADTSQYIYLAMNIGVDETGGAKTLTYRLVFDYS